MSLDLLPPTRQRIARIEAAAADALAPSVEERRDGWRLRADEAGSRRGSSVLPERRGQRGLNDKLREVRAFYRAHGRPARVQLSVACAPPDLDATLTAAGWQREEGAHVLVRSLAQVPESDPATRTADHPDAAWQELQELVTPGRAAGSERRAWALLDRGLRPLHLITTDASGRPLAGGLAVLDPERGLVGLFALVTHPEVRRRGLGRRLLRTALAQAASAGAGAAYLQVHGANAAALALYEGAGFREHHRYHYRRAPGASDAEGRDRS